jgi:hypothetical protein
MLETKDTWYDDLPAVFEAFKRGVAWPGWYDVVEAFMALGKSLGFEGSKISMTADRPGCVAWFLKNGRPWSKTVDIGIVSEFGAKYWAWVKASMVERLDSSGELVKDDRMEWKDIESWSGRNSGLMFLACLFWWGEAVHADGDELDKLGWGKAVTDFEWCLESLQSQIRTHKKKPSTKRKQIPAESNDKGKKKKGNDSEGSMVSERHLCREVRETSYGPKKVFYGATVCFSFCLSLQSSYSSFLQRLRGPGV